MAELIKNMGYFVKCAELLECPVMRRLAPPKSVPPDQLQQLQVVPTDHLWHFRWSGRTIDGVIIT